MISIEVKLQGSNESYQKIEAAIRTSRFVQNKCLRKWIDSKEVEEKFNKYTGTYYCVELRKEFPFVRELNSQACQVAAERAWQSISRFYKRAKQGVRPVGFPKFKNISRSFELRHHGWKLLPNGKLSLNNIGIFKIYGNKELQNYSKDLIKRLRIIKKADGYYCQFIIDIVKTVIEPPTGRTLGLDLGLTYFYTDSNGNTATNPKFYQKQEKKLKKLQRRLNKCQKGSNNRKKSNHKVALQHLKISRQRKDFVTKLARCVMKSNDFVAIEDLNVSKMVQKLGKAKKILDCGWYTFRQWLEYYAAQYGRVVQVVNPAYTSQDCSQCGTRVPKELKDRVHDCPNCHLKMDRDRNAAINILKRGLSTAGQAGIYASGDESLYSEQSTASEQALSLKEEFRGI